MTQDGDSKAEKEEQSLPEVEAELVRETPTAADAFEDDPPATSPTSDADEGDAGNDSPGAEPGDGDATGGPDDKPVKRKSTLTPGVMLFLAFAVVALIAFGVWRFQMKPNGDAPGEETEAPETPAIAVEDPAAPAPATGAPEADAGDALTTPVEEPIIEEPQASQGAALGEKIGNLPDDDLEPVPAPAPAPEDGSGFLPPVTEAGAAKISNTVEEGAKEAMRQFGEAGEAAGADIQPTEDIAAGATAEETTAETTAPAQTLPAEGAGQVQAPVSEEAGAAPAPIEETAAAASPLADAAASAFDKERAALAANLERARAQNDAQSREIARLRAELEARETAARIEIARLRQELRQARNEGAQQSARQMKASFALAALSRAIDQGDPYTEELTAIQEFDPRGAAALAAHAETGVATEAALRIGFDVAAREALSAAGQAEAGGGVSGLVARAKSLVSVRPARPMDGDHPGAVLSRAENALEQGEIGFALLQLEDLPLPAQEAMADWMAQARSRAEAEAALAALAAHMSGEAG